MDKLGKMGLTRRREMNQESRPHTRPAQWHPIVLQATEIPMVTVYKFLGILIYQELQWKEHVNYALQKGTKWISQY